jgi:hypothetical protein
VPVPAKLPLRLSKSYFTTGSTVSFEAAEGVYIGKESPPLFEREAGRINKRLIIHFNPPLRKVDLQSSFTTVFRLRTLLPTQRGIKIGDSQKQP